MNVLLVGNNQTSKQYIHAIKDVIENYHISLIKLNNNEKEQVEDVRYFSNFSEIKTVLTIDLVIICEDWSKVVFSFDEILSLSSPIVWDSQFVCKSEDINSMFKKVKSKKLKLILASRSKQDPQIANIYENIEKGRIGNLGVVNMKKYVPGLKSHEQELQVELEILHPYVDIIDNVFSMERKYNQHHYMTIILKLTTGSIINIEIYAGHIEYHRSGEFTGEKGVLNYNSESQTMILKKANDQVRKWTPTVFNNYLKVLEYALSKSIDKEMFYNDWEKHEQVLIIKEAILQSVKKGTPVRIWEDLSCVK